MVRASRFLILAGVFLSPTASFAQTDIAGEWAATLHEDQPHRQPGPTVGDYTGLPLNDAARLRADSWDASMYSVPEHQTTSYTPAYSVVGIAGMRISKVLDATTQQLIAYDIFRSPGTGGDRTFWMDGRSRPPEYAAHTWQGFSLGRWAGKTLIVETSHLKAGVVHRNGVPHSDRARITEYFIRHGGYVTLVAVIDDAMYFDEPLVRSASFVLAPDQQLEPVTSQIAEENSFAEGHVPHYLPGSNPYLREFAERSGLPLEATRGGRDTMYPEYAARIREVKR
jgi:hypothetical protein